MSEKEIEEKLSAVYPDHPVYSESTFQDYPLGRHVNLDLILPVMNPDPDYFRECIDSLLEQETDYSYRIICIDDGSTDPAIRPLLDKYETDYPERVTLIRQENHGVGAARNTGIRVSDCDYIGFVDQDDIVEKQYVQTLLQDAYRQNADAVKCAHKVFQDGNVIQVYEMSDHFYPDGLGEDTLSLSGMIWGGIYKRSVFDQIRFPEHYWFEDMIARLLLYPACTRFSCLSGPLYLKRRHSANASRVVWKSRDVKNLDHIYLLNHLIEERNRIGLPNDIVFFRCLLPEIGQYLMWRSRSLSGNVKKLLFQKACFLFDQYQKDGTFDEQETLYIRAFKKRSYSQWVLNAWYEWAGSR
ncbi:MAG: glycosyltransferase family 2 protein [Solobacterium sp.]|nr:glycosyltransferase family 2 protein [Solobacterium sp.]